MARTKRTRPVTPWDPSRRATARVKNPLPAPTECPFCGSEVNIEPNSNIYGRSYGEWPWAFVCSDDECDSYVGIHPYTGIPLGTLADRETRDARKRAKKKFIRWQEERGLSRNDAYRLLAQKMRIPYEKCHFGWFDVDQCDLAQHAVNRLQEQTRYNPDSPFARLRELLS